MFINKFIIAFDALKYKVIYSDDTGLTWKNADLSRTGSLNCVSFIKRNGIIFSPVLSKGIAFSKDSGLSWDTIPNVIIPIKYCEDVAIIGVAAGLNGKFKINRRAVGVATHVNGAVVSAETVKRGMHINYTSLQTDQPVDGFEGRTWRITCSLNGSIKQGF